MTRTPIAFDMPWDPPGVVEHFRQYFGPTKVAFDNLPPDAQAAMRADLEQVWAENNRATDGTTLVDNEYLTVIASKA
jgi:hypothetical protein